MTESREFNASNVDEAVAKAARETGLSEDAVSYEVLDSGSEGFLGIGARDARILVRLPDEDVVESPSPSEVEPDEAIEDEDPEPELTVDSNTEEFTVPSSYSTESEEDASTGLKEPVSEEFLGELKSLTDSILSAADISTRADVYDAGDYIAVDLISDHTALLIGQKGETIDALQHIINAAAYKDRVFNKRIVLDSEGYRQRRIEAIQGMANRMARKARREMQDVRLPPMNSAERKIVHTFLQEDARVETFSEGSGDERRVTISPN